MGINRWTTTTTKQPITMTERQLWTEMYRSHTCFKAMNRALEIKRERDIREVRIESTVAPCKMCRAWWRRAGRLGGVHATIATGTQEWKSNVL